MVLFYFKIFWTKTKSVADLCGKILDARPPVQFSSLRNHVYAAEYYKLWRRLNIILFLYLYFYQWIAYPFLASSVTSYRSSYRATPYLIRCWACKSTMNGVTQQRFVMRLTSLRQKRTAIYKREQQFGAQKGVWHNVFRITWTNTIKPIKYW